MATKRAVDRWETIATYVSTFPENDGEGACDVEVQIGETTDDDGAVCWYIRTCDDAGGSDDADETTYPSESDAREAAESFAADRDEGDGESAEDYLRRQTEERVGDEDPAGEWACYWSTVDSAGGVEGRYATQDQAEAAVAIAQAAFTRKNPSSGGVTYLCGYEVRQLVDGEWTTVIEAP